MAERDESFHAKPCRICHNPMSRKDSEVCGMCLMEGSPKRCNTCGLPYRLVMIDKRRVRLTTSGKIHICREGSQRWRGM